MKLHEIIKVADVFTLTSLVCGIIAIFLSITKAFSLAALLMFLCVICDFLDGYVAQKMHQKNSFGRELDSLCDLVSFGVTPAVFGYMLGLTTGWQIAILAMFVIAGALRLARFNVTELSHFEGVPITANGIIIPLFYVTGIFNNPQYFIILYGLMTVLMISTIKIKKPSFT